MAKILVIEDQETPWENFLLILVQICKIAKENIERARWYTEAQEKIQTGTYDIVFLDHRMPHSDPGCTDDSDFRKFSDQLQQIGYGLMPLLREKQPQAKVVGTSSLNRDEIGRYTAPEHSLTKVNMFDELPPLVQSLS